MLNTVAISDFMRIFSHSGSPARQRMPLYILMSADLLSAAKSRMIAAETSARHVV